MNIIFYGGHHWYKGPWFRKQQFALRLSNNGHKVFYIESTISMFRKKKSDGYNYFKTIFRKINDNLTIVSPSAMFPFPNNYYFRFLYNLKLFLDIRRYFKKNGISDYILWFNQIEFSSISRYSSKVTIFDLADDRPYYSILAEDFKGYKTMLKYTKLAFSNSTCAIVSAIKIKEKYQIYSKSDIIVIPNGHSIRNDTAFLRKEPKEIMNLSGPKIGFIGTLFRFIDDDLLEYIISRRPGYNFIFVGPIQDNFPINKIKHFKNVQLLGERPKTSIPNYIDHFDICINPFKVHEVNDSVSPVKVFEYLALKKPVLSTKMYSLMQERISENIVFASDYQDFIKKLDNILCNPYSISISESLIQLYHWDNLFSKLLNELKVKHNIIF